MGVRQSPNENTVLGAMQNAIREPESYCFPGIDKTKAADSEDEARVAKIKQGPTGIHIIHSEGCEVMSPRLLGTELATNTVSAVLATFLPTQVQSGFGGRVLFVNVLGLFGLLIASAPHWNSYGFSLDYTRAQLPEMIIGSLLAALVMASFVRPINGQATA